MDRAAREADLVTYYNNEARDRQAGELAETRIARRDVFIELLRKEGRESVVEVGTGPGRDSVAFDAAGLRFRGIDLAPASVTICQQSGLDVEVGSALELPYAAGEFDAAYTASTLLHIADSDLDTALAELTRVVHRGSPIAIGLWGAQETHEERWGDPTYGPPRFFALRSDADLQASLARHGTLESFETWPAEVASELHYQWAILRATGRSPDNPHARCSRGARPTRTT